MDYESIVNKYGLTTKQLSFDYGIYDLLLNIQDSYISYLPQEIIKYIIYEFLMESEMKYIYKSESENEHSEITKVQKSFYECLDKYEIFLIVSNDEYTIGKRINTSKFIYSRNVFDVIYSTNDKYNISKIIQVSYEELSYSYWVCDIGNPPGINIEIVEKIEIENDTLHMGDNKSYDEITLIPLYNK